MGVQGPNGNNPFIGKQSYGIEKRELDALHAELKANKDVKFSDKNIADIDKAIMEGNLGEYLDNIGDSMKNALGLSLSSKIGETDTTQDIEAAKKLAETAKLKEDCDLQKVLKYIDQAKNTSTVKHIDLTLRKLDSTRLELEFNSLVDILKKDMPKLEIPGQNSSVYKNAEESIKYFDEHLFGLQ